jgi:hypothetical protein
LDIKLTSFDILINSFFDLSHHLYRYAHDISLVGREKREGFKPIRCCGLGLKKKKKSKKFTLKK